MTALQTLSLLLDFFLVMLSLALSAITLMKTIADNKRKWSFLSSVFSVAGLLSSYLQPLTLLTYVLSGISLMYFIRTLDVLSVFLGKKDEQLNKYIAISCGIGRITGGVVVDLFILALQSKTAIEFAEWGLLATIPSLVGGVSTWVLEKRSGRDRYLRELVDLKRVKRYETIEEVIISLSWALGVGAVTFVNRIISLAIIAYLVLRFRPPLETTLTVIERLTNKVADIKNWLWQNILSKAQATDISYIWAIWYDSFLFILMTRLLETDNPLHYIITLLIALFIVIDYLRVGSRHEIWLSIGAILLTLFILFITAFWTEGNPIRTAIFEFYKRVPDAPAFSEIRRMFGQAVLESILVSVSFLVMGMLLLFRQVFIVSSSVSKMWGQRKIESVSLWSAVSDDLLFLECKKWCQDHRWKIIVSSSPTYLCAKKGTLWGFTDAETERFIQINITKLPEIELRITNYTDWIISKSFLLSEVCDLEDHLKRTFDTKEKIRS